MKMQTAEFCVAFKSKCSPEKKAEEKEVDAADLSIAEKSKDVKNQKINFE